MENKLIWVLKLDSTEKYLDIELYVGRNKYTKLGLFQDPYVEMGLMNLLRILHLNLCVV